MSRKFALILTAALLVGAVTGASASLAQDATGTLQFYANGEDFVRQGFVSKDGWAITFDHVYVTLAEIAAYQTDPPYEPEMEDDLIAIAEVKLEDMVTIDLAEGDEDAAPIFVGERTAPEGRYNALAWSMIPAPEGEAEGYTLVITGTATREDEAIAFTIKVEHEYEYVCGEYVGDERKGILDADDVADLEMTFHFDHLFGDGDLPPDDALNEHAPGFDIFAAQAEDNSVEVDMAALESMVSEDDYQMLVDILPTLGHVGEGHCYEAMHEVGQE